MPNNFTSVVKQHWAEGIQEQLYKTLTCMAMARMENIPNGTTKNLPVLNLRSTADYTKYVPQTIQDVNTRNDQIVINKTPMVTFAMDRLDQDDNYIDLIPELIRDGAYKIRERIDGDFFSQGLNAKWAFDATGVKLNTGTLTPITLTQTGPSTTQNVSTTYAKAKAILTTTGANADRMDLAVDSFVAVELQGLGLSINTDLSTMMYRAGYRGDFSGMRTFESSSLTGTGTLAFATIPVANDTISIRGVTFTYVATATLPGHIAIGGTASTAQANTVSAINKTGTPGAGTYIDIIDDDRSKIDAVVATSVGTNINLVSKNGALLASSKFTPATNRFGIQALNTLVMERGSIRMALRPDVEIEDRGVPTGLVTNYFIWARYGLLAPIRGRERMCIVPIVNQVAETY